MQKYLQKKVGGTNIRLLIKLLRIITTTKILAKAMIYVGFNGYKNNIIVNRNKTISM